MILVNNLTYMLRLRYMRIRLCLDLRRRGLFYLLLDRVSDILNVITRHSFHLLHQHQIVLPLSALLT